jgi:hypothetical protein
MDSGDVVNELERAAVVEVRGCLAVSHTDETIYVDDREALLILPEGTTSGTADLETLNAERFDVEVAVGPGAEFGNVAADEAEAGLIKEVSTECMDVLNGQAIVGESGVIAEVRIEIDVREVPRGINVMEEE